MNGGVSMGVKFFVSGFVPVQESAINGAVFRKSSKMVSEDLSGSHKSIHSPERNKCGGGKNQSHGWIINLQPQDWLQHVLPILTIEQKFCN